MSSDLSYARGIAAVGTGLAGLSAGMAWSAHGLFLPIWLNTPEINAQTKLRCFPPFYYAGKYAQVPLSVASALALVYAGNKFPRDFQLDLNNFPCLVSVAGLSTFALIPWTAFVITPVNQRLFDMTKAPKGEIKAQEIEGELGRWLKLHVVRSLMLTAGLGLGLYALV